MVPPLRKLNDSEDGAVLLIVALMLTAFMVLLALVADLGGQVAEKRIMVRAADASALAAAQSCARTGLEKEDPEAIADSYAQMNEDALTPASGGITELVGCHTGSGHVTVQYTIERELFFAPVIGIDTGTVAAEATAAWGAPGLLPVMINTGTSGGYSSCTVPAAEGTICYILFDNDNLMDNNDATGTWGFLNLETWGATSDQGCSGPGANVIRGWIDGSMTYPDLLYDAPNYVCRTSGEQVGPSWNQAFGSIVGQIRTFPLNDPSMNTAKRWYIVAFSSMEILGVGTNSASYGESCPLTPPNAIGGNKSYACLKLRVVSSDSAEAELIRLVK